MENSANHPEPPDAEPPESLADDAAMIAAMRSYREAKADLDQRKERGAAYLEQVEQEIKADLAADEQHFERLRSSMLTFLTEHNGGKKFSVPGLGVAYTSTRRVVTIENEERFTTAYAGEFGQDRLSRLYRIPTLVHSKVRKEVEAKLREDGEVIAGTHVDDVTSISVRLSNPDAER